MQEFAVALIVALAAAYIGMQYMPARLRRRLSLRLAAYPRAARVFGKAAGCGSGCDTCGTCDTTPADGAPPPAARVIRIHPRD